MGLQTCVKAVWTEFENYKLYAVLPNLLNFLDEVTHWYVPLNREHLRGQSGEHDAEMSLKTLYLVLQSLCTLMAPVTPFLTEAMYQNLRNGMQNPEESVHYLRVPEVQEHLYDSDLERQVATMMHAVTLGRAARDKSKVSFKVPLTKMVVVHPDQSYLDDVSTLKTYVQKMLNVKSLEFSSKVTSFVMLSATPNNRAMGKHFRGDARKLNPVVSALTHEQVSKLQAEGTLKVSVEEKEFTLTLDHVTIEVNFCGDESRFAAVGPDNGLLVALDTQLDEKLLSEGHARNFVSRVQNLRKEAQLEASDSVQVYVQVPQGSELAKVVSQHADYVEKAVRSMVTAGEPPAEANTVAQRFHEGRHQVAGTSFTLFLT